MITPGYFGALVPLGQGVSFKYFGSNCGQRGFSVMPSKVSTVLLLLD